VNGSEDDPLGSLLVLRDVGRAANGKAASCNQSECKQWLAWPAPWPHLNNLLMIMMGSADELARGFRRTQPGGRDPAIGGDCQFHYTNSY
jgi:hypothetical protein